MPRQLPVARYGQRLLEPGFGIADIALDALGRSSPSRSAA